MAGESGKEDSWSHSQEPTHNSNAQYRSSGKVRAGNEMTADAISYQEIEDDHIQQTDEQARRVGFASNGPIQVDDQNVGDKSSHPDDWQDDPMAAKAVKENVADRNRSNHRRVKPKEHTHVIARPEVVCDPLHKSAVEKRFVQDMNDV